jgi:serine/threonine protein kinase/tetratricopeptide (TPR) repeat protein
MAGPETRDEPDASASTADAAAEPEASAERAVDTTEAAEPDSQRTITGEVRSGSPSRPPPQHLGGGRFEILGLLGEGGMGEVFRARDLRLDREVALKRLKSWVIDERARGRLAREAQAMAQLSHPNVIEVYGVELEDDFLLVMELIGGPTLAAWMHGEPRPWREVLAIFVQAGRGLEAAHAAGLVHRDFKPSNVMLGDDGRVRVMDFGLAQPPGASRDEDRSERSAELPSPAASSDDPRGDALTATGMVVGTPAYMAPEQFQALSADGRTDQYAFCVALWQALCGERPFQGSYVELGRAKYRGPPPWPKAVAVPRRLVAAIRRGLAPEPSARWPSMAHVLAELESVVRATPLRRALYLAAGASMVAGAAAAIAISWPTPSASCDDPETLRRTLWDDAQRDAVEAALLGSPTTYAASAWARVGPALDAYASEWARARYVACEASLGQPGDDALLDARLDARLGCLQSRQRSFEALVGALSQVDDGRGTGLAAAAGSEMLSPASEASTAVERLPSLAACDDPIRLQAELPPPEDPAVAARVAELREGLARADAQRGVARCSAAATELAAIAPEVEAIGHAPLQAELRLGEGLASDCAGDYAAAETALREAYFLASELRHGYVASHAALNLVQVVGVAQERHEEGMQWSEHARAELARVGDPSAEALYLEYLGNLHHTAGRYDEAVAAYERGLTRLPPGETSMHAVFLGNLGSTLRVLGRLEQARARHEESLAITERLVGADHPDITWHLVNLANVDNDLGEHVRAEELQRRALGRIERDLGPTHPSTLQVLGNLALSLSLQGRLAEAIALHERVIAGLAASVGSEHPDVATGLNNLGIDQLGLGDVAGAIGSHRRALAIREQALGAEHMLTASSLSNLADAELAAGHPEAAREGYARALTVFERALGPDALPVSYPLIGSGRALVAAGDVEAALPLLERGLALRERGSTPPELFEARFELGRAVWALGRDPERARKLVSDAVAGVADVEGDVPPREEAQAWLREHPP